MGAGEGCMTTEIDFDGGGEPAQIEAVGLLKQKGRFGEVHFTGYVLHPVFIAGLW
jgi:hypothetical protein